MLLETTKRSWMCSQMKWCVIPYSTRMSAQFLSPKKMKNRLSFLLTWRVFNPAILQPYSSFMFFFFNILLGRYCVAFDPLDGSSNIDCNVATGTIFSVWDRVCMIFVIVINTLSWLSSNECFSKQLVKPLSLTFWDQDARYNIAWWLLLIASYFIYSLF